MTNNELSKHDHVLAGLVFSLQAATMQQLGKIQNPMTGEMERDLEQARGTIDLLEMLKVKCRTDTPEDLLRMIDGAVMDLQLNYMDEMKKEAGKSEEKDDAPGEASAAESASDDDSGEPESEDPKPAAEGDG